MIQFYVYYTTSKKYIKKIYTLILTQSYSTSNTFSLSTFKSSELRETTGKRPRPSLPASPARIEHSVVAQEAIIHTANIEAALVRVGTHAARSHPISG